MVPSGTMQNMKKTERALLWAATDKVSGGQCKVYWDMVCRPKNLGGLGIINVDFFVRDLRLCYRWLEWKAPGKILVCFGNPSNEIYLDLFYATTIITLGDG
jgi:hypothetical protein